MSAAEHEAQSLREASAGWRDMGRHLEDAVRGLDREVGRARSAHWQGPAAEAFTSDWARLRKSVDEALPVFELAAADLDRAAARVEESAGRDDGAAAPAERAEPLPASYNVAYAFTALSQIGSALGATFARGRGAGVGSRGRSGLARSTSLPASEAPRGADPFGPPETGGAAKEKPTGGLGVAAGRRSPSHCANAEESSGTPAEATPGAGIPDGQQSRKAPAPPAAPEPAADTERRAPHAPAEDLNVPRDTTPAQPDPRRHGAFG